jgi:tetratricopeptide (TPR) repeat protein
MRQHRYLALIVLALTPGIAAAQRVKLLVPLDSLVARATRDSNDAPAQYEAALGYWYNRKYDAAEARLREAVAIDPKMAEAYLALAFLPYARRPRGWDEEADRKVPSAWQATVDEAWSFRRKAFLINPMVDLKPLALMIPPPEAIGLKGALYTIVVNGFGSFWDGQYGRAYDFFRELGGQTPHDRRPSWLLWYEGLAAAHINEFGQAIADFQILLGRAEQVEQLDGGAALAFSSSNHYRYTLACLLDLSGSTKEAAEMLQQVLTTDAGLYMAHVRLASIYSDRHRTQSAIEERRRAVAANPDDPSLVYDLGETLARTGELADAEAALLEARRANPRNVRALYILGWVQEQLGEAEAAHEAYRAFLQLAPSRFDQEKAELEQKLAAAP